MWGGIRKLGASDQAHETWLVVSRCRIVMASDADISSFGNFANVRSSRGPVLLPTRARRASMKCLPSSQRREVHSCSR